MIFFPPKLRVPVLERLSKFGGQWDFRQQGWLLQKILRFVGACLASDKLQDWAERFAGRLGDVPTLGIFASRAGSYGKFSDS